MLNDGTEHIAGFLHIQFRCLAPFVLNQETVNGKGCIKVRVDRPQGIQRRLKRAHVGQDAFGGEVEVVKVRGLGFSEKGLHVQQTRHLLMALIQGIAEGSRGTSRKQAKTDGEQAH